MCVLYTIICTTVGNPAAIIPVAASLSIRPTAILSAYEVLL